MTTEPVCLARYFAGTVNQFDGAFERLRVEPGEHELTVYLEGFRTRAERLYLSANSTRTIRGTLEPLPAGAPISTVRRGTDRTRATPA